MFLRLTAGATTWYVQRKIGGKRTVRAVDHFLPREGAEAALPLGQARKRAQIWLGLMAVKMQQLSDNAKVSRVPAGFPSSAQDYLDDTADLNEALIIQGHDAATFVLGAKDRR